MHIIPVLFLCHIHEHFTAEAMQCNGEQNCTIRDKLHFTIMIPLLRNKHLFLFPSIQCLVIILTIASDGRRLISS